MRHPSPRDSDLESDAARSTLVIAPYLSVVIPVYNEQGSVRALHESLRSALDKTAFAYEILFVNDGSTDGTGDNLQDM
jgi:glycosyltransferase involved in cell wall biosynthesis